MPADLNPTAASLLGFLHQGPMTGWDLAQAVADTIGDFWNVTRSQVYRELRTLEQQGLIKPGETGARDRLPYTLTDEGRQAFKRWIAREPGADVIRSPLLLTVWFGGHLDEGLLVHYLTMHRLLHQQRLATYEALHAQLEGQLGAEWSVYALRYGIEHERAVLRWMEALPWFSAAGKELAALGRGGR